MSGLSLYATVEKRLETLMELARRNEEAMAGIAGGEWRPSITISREFGCEGIAVAELCQTMLQESTGAVWGLMDKAILDRIANDRDHTLEVLRNLGEKNPFLDDMMSTILTDWKSDKDYYRLLCNQILPFARQGRMIIVGVGAGILTQSLANCFHFRIVAPLEFRIESVAKRHGITEEEAQRLIVKSQKQRAAFISSFLNRDVADPALYSIVFNRAHNSIQDIAEMICHRVLKGGRQQG